MGIHVAVTREKMRELDRSAIEDYGIPSLILMENAGLRVAEAVEGLTANQSARVAIACGKGNNGGDGLVVARHLSNHGYKVHVYLFASSAQAKGDSLTNLTIWKRMKGDITEVLAESDMSIFQDALSESDMIVDALFGTGLEKEVTGLFRSAIESINKSGKPVVAVDVPSGLCADTGRVMGTAVKAKLTVALGLSKRGLSTNEGPEYCGTIRIVDISLPKRLMQRIGE